MAMDTLHVSTSEEASAYFCDVIVTEDAAGGGVGTVMINSDVTQSKNATLSLMKGSVVVAPEHEWRVYNTAMEDLAGRITPGQMARGALHYGYSGS